MKLADPRKKRDRDRTPEPPEKEPPPGQGTRAQNVVADLAARAPDLEARAAALGAPVHPFDARRLVPMPCAPEGAPSAGTAWLYELKLDGVRALAVKDDAGTAIMGRKLRDTAATYPEVERALRALPPARLVLDGEVIALDALGRPSFARLAQRIHLTKPPEIRRAEQAIPVVFVAFDLLAVGARDLTPLPLTARKALLHALLPAPGVIRAMDHVEGDGSGLLAFCVALDLEGLVAKRLGSPYRPGPRRSGDWVKMKRTRDEDFVVVGYTRGEGSRARLGALDLGSFVGGELVNRGKIGSGLNGASIDALLTRLAPLAVPEPQGRGALVPAPRGRIHVRPEIVVRVRFDGFSEDGHLLRGVYLGLRDDVDAADCTALPHREKPPSPEPIAAHPSPAPAPAPADEHVPVTNPRKLLFPGITKAELVAYYRTIAPVILPYLRDRPVMLVRYPDGIDGKSFYQWNVPAGTPPWIRTLRLRDDDGAEEEVFLLDGERALAHVANLAAIPLHVLASRAPSLTACDFLTLDLDVGGASLREGIALARALHALLDAIGLPGFPKTSGQTGLHVLVPLGPGVSYVTARALADLLGRLVCERHPTIATMERIIARRGPRVYVDTGQTGPTRTIVAPYAVRARPGAPVSTPLLWSEIEPGLDPAAFTIRTVPARILALGDPMADLFSARPDVPAVVTQLARLMERR